jgi:hypothetical protein
MDCVAQWKFKRLVQYLQRVDSQAHATCDAHSYVNPSPLIECLRLPPNEQQDAQEFYKLFMQILEQKIGRSAVCRNKNRLGSFWLGGLRFLSRQSQYPDVDSSTDARSGSNLGMLRRPGPMSSASCSGARWRT